MLISEHGVQSFCIVSTKCRFWVLTSQKLNYKQAVLMAVLIPLHRCIRWPLPLHLQGVGT